MKKISLSYVITTRNKLEYLKILLNDLLDNIQPDEEIVITDGDSNDGTIDYVQGLYEQGKVHQFISEPDYCQAHGCNKALLMAKGEIIKILTDDDIFDYRVIHKCKTFLLENIEVDVLIGNVIYSNNFTGKKDSIDKTKQNEYVDWLNNDGPAFWFGDQGLFIRRSKLALFGLWHTGISSIDVEKSICITSLKQLNIAWCTGVVSFSIINKDSLSVSEGYASKNYHNLKRIYRFYKPENHEKIVQPVKKKQGFDILAPIKFGKRAFIYLLNKIKKIFHHEDHDKKFEDVVKLDDIDKPDYLDLSSEVDNVNIYIYYRDWLFRYNDENKIKFIWSKGHERIEAT